MRDVQKMDFLSRRGFIVGTAVTGVALASHSSVSAAPLVASPPAGDWTDGGVIKRGGGSIQWASMGEGPVIVMMPKLGGWLADWRHVAKLLAPQYRVIAIDPPGHGGSVMATPPPYIHTLPESAAMVRAALGVLGVERYNLVGNSLGGCIATIMAALFPDDVANLVLVSVALSDRFTAEELAAYDARDSEYDANGLPLYRDAATMAARFGTTPEINEEQNASRAAAGLWIRPSERGVFTCGITDYLPRIGANVALVYGKANEGVYQVFRDKALSLIPKVQSIDIEGAGAFLHQQKPAETAKLISAFIKNGKV